MASEPGFDHGSGMSLGDTCLLPRRRPACRWREVEPGLSVNVVTCRLESVPGGQSGRVGDLQDVISVEELSTGCGALGRTVLF
jgi:hypothetical protein